MKASEIEEKMLYPLVHTGRAFYVFLAVLLGIAVWVLYAWYVQLTHGLIVTGMRDTPGGAPWGIYIANFVFFIGITHAGIAIASAIRILKLKQYIPIARMAELITIFSLIMAALSIIFDLGRPDRVFNLILHYPERLSQSPLIWDLTAIATYLILAISYLYIEMREDLVICMEKVPRLRWLYKLLLPLYTPGEREQIERIVWWASIVNFPIMVMVHTTVAWIFGLMVSQSGWFSAIMGPYYVAGAVYSGVASVVVAAAIYRRLYKWEEFIKPEIFKGMGNFLTVVAAIYLYFLLAEHITVRYAGPIPEFSVSQALMFHEFAWLFWLQVAGLFMAFIIFFVQSVHPKAFSIGRTVFASAIVVIVLWVTRYLIVLPSLTRPRLPYPYGVYIPTWVELSLVSGTFILIILLFTLFTKIFPILPITEMRKARRGEV